MQTTVTRLALSVEETTIAPNAFLFASLQPYNVYLQTWHRNKSVTFKHSSHAM